MLSGNVHARKEFEHEYHLLKGQLHNGDIRAILANGHLLYAQARLLNRQLIWQQYPHVSVRNMQPDQSQAPVSSP